jgi:hypothetical protein
VACADPVGSRSVSDSRGRLPLQARPRRSHLPSLLLSCKRGVVDIYSQRAKVPDAGASGQGVCNRDGAASGEGDCGSAPCFGPTASGETKTGDFFGSSAVFGPCSLLRGLSSSPKIFSGGRLSVASGMVSFSSSIEAHPTKPRLANTAIKMSTSRAQARIENPVIRRTDQRGPIRTYAGKRNLTHGDLGGDPMFWSHNLISARIPRPH